MVKAEIEEKTQAKEKPSWIKMKSEEIEKIIVDLAKKGETPAKIGLVLRDKYGVPNLRIFGKRIVKILNEKGITYKSEKDIIEFKIKKLNEHIAKNKHDSNVRGVLTKKLWALHKLTLKEDA